MYKADALLYKSPLPPFDKGENTGKFDKGENTGKFDKGETVLFFFFYNARY